MTSDLQAYRELVQPTVFFFGAMLTSGAVVAYATQFLKSDMIPAHVQKYKRTTAAILSLVATIVSLYLTSLNYTFNGFFSVVSFFIGVFLVSAWTYRNVIKSSAPNETKEVPPADAIK